MKPSTIALNEAILHHVIHQIHEGNFNACKAMGFNEDQIAKLLGMSPKELSRLAYSRVTWGNVVLNPVFDRLLNGLDDNRDLIINRAVRLGASSTMMMDVFGLNNGETAQRRRILGIPSRKGRPTELTDNQKADIWHRWKALVAEAERPVSQLSVQEKLDLAMVIAEEQNTVLANVWQEINSYPGAANVC
ncbi:MAG: DUF2857 domain-containing protein [Burkholderiales bacterium]|jgi:hypothetical protein|nr:DUF2857 domain-containing protein [Burkholderiales bacterium]